MVANYYISDFVSNCHIQQIMFNIESNTIKNINICL